MGKKIPHKLSLPIDQNTCIVYAGTTWVFFTAPSVDPCFLASLLNTNNAQISRSYQLHTGISWGEDDPG